MTTPCPTGVPAGPPRGCGPTWERPGARPATHRASWLFLAGYAHHAGLCEQVRERGRWRCVGEEHIDLVEPRQLHHRRAVELAVVGRDPHLTRVLDDRARDLDLAVVKSRSVPSASMPEMPIKPMSTLNCL